MPRQPRTRSSGRVKNEKEERFYVPLELAKDLDEISRRRNQSKSDYVRRIVERQAKIDLAELRGLESGAAETDPLNQWAAEVRQKVDDLVASMRTPPVLPGRR